MSAFSPDLGAVEKFSRRISRFARTQTSHPIRALQIVAREIKFGYHRMWHKTGDPTPPIMAINAHERTSQIDRLTATTRVKLPPSHSHYWRPSTQPALQPPMQPAKRPSRARQYPLAIARYKPGPQDTTRQDPDLKEKCRSREEDPDHAPGRR